MEPLADITNSNTAQDRQNRRSSMGTTPNGKSRRRSLLDSTSKAAAKGTSNRRKSRLGGRNLAEDMEHQTSTAAEARRNLLDPEQVSALYQQCIKLATENKITSKNTWALGLIDHLHDLVKPNEQEGNDTNFQRASITLGAGVEIYSKRVDSIHTAAYKVLSGLSKGRGADDEEADENEDELQVNEEGNTAKENTKAARRAAMLRDVDPSSTLEASFETLNVKRFDLAFAVDPLFQRTSAQFDEGGARGLLLNNLSVYNGCEILFDSQEVPGRQATLSQSASPAVELGATLRSCFEEAERAAEEGARICPALDELYSLNGQPTEDAYTAEIATLMSFVRANLHEYHAESSMEAEDQPLAELSSDDDNAFEDAFDDHDYGNAGMAEDMEEGGSDEAAPVWMTQEPFETQESALDMAGESLALVSDVTDMGQSARDLADRQAEASNGDDTAVDWLISGVENLSLEGKAWAGASHWHYRTRAKESLDPAVTSPPPKPARATKKKGGPIDFFNLPELPEDALAQANLKEITLKNWPAKANTLLPEDLHYKPSQLFELFLVPDIPFHKTQFYRGSANATQLATSQEERINDFGDYGDDDCGNGGSDGEDGLDGWGDVNFDATDDLISAPRKVAQIGINYARASKQVDVKALKHTLWQCIGEEHDRQLRHSSQDEGLSFNHVLSKLSASNVVGSLQDLSVHLCFICLLHLANENGLRITGAGSLDQMLIWDIPSASVV